MWSTPSDPEGQPQQLQFPGPRFAPSVDPRAGRGDGPFGAADAVRVESAQSGMPPPGFGKVSHQSATYGEPVNAYGGMPNREENQHRRRCFDSRTLNKELWITEASQGAFGIVPRNPHVDNFFALTASGDTTGMMYREQRHDHFLSTTPPDMNANIPINRMPYREPHTLPSRGGRTLCGDQHTPQITGARMLPRGQGQLDPGLENMPQREIKWQGNSEERGHASQKLPNANVRDLYGKTPMNEMHYVTLPAGTSVPVDVRDVANDLHDSGIRELTMRHGVDCEVIAKAKKFEVSNQKSDIRFAGHGHDDENDVGRDHGLMIEQLTESLVISGNSRAKEMELQKISLRSKVNLPLFQYCIKHSFD